VLAHTIDRRLFEHDRVVLIASRSTLNQIDLPKVVVREQ
jgi:hypothetical protein